MIKNLLVNAGAARDTSSIPWIGTIPRSQKWQPAPVLLPGKFHRQRSLEGKSPWSHKESDMTEELSILGAHKSPMFYILHLHSLEDFRSLIDCHSIRINERGA